MKKILSYEELGDKLCDNCIVSNYGTEKVNTDNYNTCDGSYCDEAYEEYVLNLQMEE